MEGLFGLLLLALLAVPVLLIVALAKIGGLKGRVAALEDTVAQLQWNASSAETTPLRDAWTRGPVVSPSTRDTPPTPTPTPGPGPGPGPGADRRAVFEAGPPPASGGAEPPREPRTHDAGTVGSPNPAAAPHSRAPRASRTPPHAPDPLSLALRAVRRWFTEGNVPVKVGMLVLFAGVAALLKYANDQGWVSLPLELRLAGIALAAVGGLVFGWRQRDRKRGFALAVQGGAIGVLLLVVFAAFKLYGFIPAGTAFALSVVLVAGVGVLAVKQDAIALAVLGLVAGFLAPIWLSTGAGSHIALFGYYAVLNAAIFAIAWVRPWRVLNVLGFVFTFGIGTVWGVLKYRPQDFATTEPFLLLFFVFYLLIPLLYAGRRAAGRRDLLDGCLVFGMPLVAFSLQAGLLDGGPMPLAFCALGLGAIYAVLAAWLRRREHYAALVGPYAVLAVGFATLAVPLALSAQASGCVFALEGAALVWLGLRQQRGLQQLAGGLLQLGAALSFAIGANAATVPLQPIANPTFMGALLIALAGFASAWSYWRATTNTTTIHGAQPVALALPYYLWGLAWWIGTGMHEIERFVAADTRVDALLGLAIATGWVAVELHRRVQASALLTTGIAALVATVPLALLQDAEHAQPLAGHGWVAWLLVAVAGWRILQGLRGESSARIALAHTAWLIAWPLVFALLLHDWGDRSMLGEGWRQAAIALPWLAMAALLQWRPQWVAKPVAESFGDWRGRVQGLFAVAVALGWLLQLWSAGNATPLPWLPLLNPLDIAQLAAFAILAAWLHGPHAPLALRDRRIPLLAFAAFVQVSVITLRATHHFGGIEWQGAMASTSLVQASLTVVWSVLGVLGWIIGSRRGQRGLWLAGAVLMAIVLAKLVLIDRQHLGSGFGIASFLAYGLLCTAVGYFAPAPPRTPASDPSPDLQEAVA